MYGWDIPRLDVYKLREQNTEYAYTGVCAALLLLLVLLLPQHIPGHKTKFRRDRNFLTFHALYLRLLRRQIPLSQTKNRIPWFYRALLCMRATPFCPSVNNTVHETFPTFISNAFCQVSEWLFIRLPSSLRILEKIVIFSCGLDWFLYVSYGFQPCAISIEWFKLERKQATRLPWILRHLFFPRASPIMQYVMSSDWHGQSEARTHTRARASSREMVNRESSNRCDSPVRSI